LKKQADLFGEKDNEPFSGEAPLAERMRPKGLEEFVGQDHLLGPGKVLRQAIESDQLPSMILWGPPGSGKTTLAMVIASTTGAQFTAFSAVLSGVKEIREVIGEAGEEWRRTKRRTLLFVDEIHRFNKAQQDAFLPHVEKGTIILIGATTENPSFEVISPPALQYESLYPQASEGGRG
jgi:putative ATPase